MQPQARQDKLLVQEVGDELVVYDQKRHVAHSLNRTAALVWQNCDGQRTVADLAALLGLPLVVVARRSLGTLNHTLMTVEVALARQLRVAGVVVCETSTVTTFAETSNVEELRARLPVPILAVVPYRPGGYDGEIPELAGTDWWSLAD